MASNSRPTCTEKLDTCDVRTHVLVHDVLQELPVYLKGRRTVHGRVRLCLRPSVRMLNVPVPLQRGLLLLSHGPCVTRFRACRRCGEGWRRVRARGREQVAELRVRKKAGRQFVPLATVREGCNGRSAFDGRYERVDAATGWW